MAREECSQLQSCKLTLSGVCERVGEDERESENEDEQEKSME